ncbi:FAD binding domain-containing protein, partial [[Eubacterium] cellulosolvens]
MRFDVFLPPSLNDLLRLLECGGDEVHLIAGGTDLLPRILREQTHVKLVADMSHIAELNFVKRKSRTIRIGALTRISELADNRLLNGNCEAIREVSSMLASPPVRNMATVGGNVAAPSSFRDLFTVLLAMDAQAVLQSLKGKRTAALEDLFLQDGRVDVKPNEIIAEIFFDDLPRDSWCSFGKVG